MTATAFMACWMLRSGFGFGPSLPPGDGRSEGGSFRNADLLPALLDELRDEARPARLVARADAGAVVAVEVLVEEHVVAEVRVRLEPLVAAEDRAPPAGILQEDPVQAPRDFPRDVPQRPHAAA